MDRDKQTKAFSEGETVSDQTLRLASNCEVTRENMSTQNAEENALDDEVSACLSGLPGYKSDDDQSSSPSSCSFHSSRTVAGVDSEVDSMSNYSWHSTGTLRDVDTDTASYCSVDTVMGDSDNMSNYSFYSTGTLRDADTDTASFCSADTIMGDTEGGKEEVNITKMVEEGDTKSSNKRQSKDSSPDLPEDDPSTNITPHSSPPDFSFTRPGYLAGSNSSVDNDSRSSLVSEGDISLAGQVNDRLGQLLGYAGEGADGVDAEDAIANIMGYEIIVKEKDKFTVYKIRVSCPSSVFRTWFIHRRYSDFFNLRQTLIKENQASAPKLAFPSKRWVGSNFDPTFLGRRLAGLQVFLGNILDVKALKTNKALMEFLCLDKPPVGQTGIEDKRAICDTLEEAVKELRKQLRKKDLLMKELDYQKKLNSEKDNQIQELYTENKLLRKQKESLMNSLR